MLTCIQAASVVVMAASLNLPDRHAPSCPPFIVTPQRMQEMAPEIHKYCPSEQTRIDTLYGALVREKGRLPFGFELWTAYDAAIGQPLIIGPFTPESFCAMRGVHLDGTPLAEPAQPRP